MGTLHWSRTCSRVRTFDFVRSAASETALRRILFPPKMVNCLEGLKLRSRGAAAKASGTRSSANTNKVRKRQVVTRTSCPLTVVTFRQDLGSCAAPIALPMRACGSPPFQIVLRWVRDTTPVVYPLVRAITSTLKSISENYGKIEGFLSDSRLI